MADDKINTANIPTIFWHALSFCMVVATLAMVVIAYKSTSVSIEIANTKINLSSALNETKEIKFELQNDYERLKQGRAALLKKINLLEEKAIASSSKSISVKDLKMIKTLESSKSVNWPELKFKSLDTRFEAIQKNLATK